MTKDEKNQTNLQDDMHGVVGMTLRDHIAINASDKDVEKYQEWYIFRESWGITVVRDWRCKYSRAEARYRYADAMLAAREGKQHEHD